MLNTDAAMIVHGFLQLPNLEKLTVVNAINEYFDEVDKREAIRKAHDEHFESIKVVENGVPCKCCGRS